MNKIQFFVQVSKMIFEVKNKFASKQFYIKLYKCLALENHPGFTFNLFALGLVNS